MLITKSLSDGGAERVAANLSMALEGQYHVVIVTYTQAQNEYAHAGTRINLNLQGRGLAGKIVCALKRIAAVRRLKREHGIDYSVSFIPQCDYANVLSKRRGEKTVIEISNTMSAVYASPVKTFIRRLILKRADKLVAISSGIKGDLTSKMGIPPEKTAVIHNSCDIDGIRECCAKAAKAEFPGRYIVTAGSFRREKGHWHLIRAFASISDAVPDVSLVILGEGGYRAQYEQLIRALGLEGRVVMPGFVNPPYGVIAGSELFAFSSIDEGFGNVIIEAMACGVPVVAADCRYGPREILAPHADAHQEMDYDAELDCGVLTPGFGTADIDLSTEVTAEEQRMGREMLALLNSPERRQQYVRRTEKYVEQYGNGPFGEQWSELFRGL